jgi:Animal haem peroxidase
MMSHGMREVARRLLTVTALVGFGLAVKQALRAPERVEQTRYVYQPSALEELWADLAVWVDQCIGWAKLPTPIGLVVLIGERIRLREKNLHDTETLPKLPQPAPQAPDTSHFTQRTLDGTFNDLDVPSMGSAGTRFGRNVPNEFTYPDAMPEIMTPNPRVVSRELLTRDSFSPATTLNMLAAAWIQFMTRDWFTHGSGDKDRAWQVPLPPGDTFPQSPMLIPATVADATRPADAAGAPPTHQNFESAWWDASQIYPNDPAIQKVLRSGTAGKLNLSRQGAGDGLLPPDILAGLADRPGWWLGLGLMYTLFTREHNAICDALAAEYPSWSDDELFARARLINAALMAKIHTVEWTPAIVSHPTTAYALRAQWFGVEGERLRTTFGRLTEDEVISGIPGSPTNHHSAPYSLTEEFVAVYRMHALIRDEYSFRATANDASIEDRTFEQITDSQANALLQAIPTQDLFYSFGTLYPGALALHNYPRFLQHFTRPDKQIVDLASIDVMRMRELGVPRYALFRELMHMRPVRTFEDVTANPAWARQMREVYDGRLDRLDLMIGMFAEPKPTGFGFSDTAFRVFILMASRRLKSDRFFTRDFTPEVYTPLGMTWINTTSMIDVLLRHYPGLRPAMRGIDNAFVPWVGTR